MQKKPETLVGIFILCACALFVYMTFFLGVFRFSAGRYRTYTVCFDTVAGLERKADVKIAGVKVGWIERVRVEYTAFYTARADIMVHNTYTLHENARALVRQDSFLGTKYLEIIPGDASLPLLSPDTAYVPGTSSASIDTILQNAEGITKHMQEITGALGDCMSGAQGKQEMKEMVDNLQRTIAHCAHITQTLDRSVHENEENLHVIMSDLRHILCQMKEMLPSIDHNIHQAREKMDSTLKAFEGAAGQAQEGFKYVSSITQKIDEGKGMVGKLINEEDTYRDIKVSIQSLRKYFNKVDALNIIFDSHGEYMYRPAEHVNFEDSKGYMDIRIHPNDDHFYVLQYVMAQKGEITRTMKQVKWFDEKYQEIFPSQTFNEKIRIGYPPELFGNIEIRERVLDRPKLGFQFGKIYQDIAVRVGIFENSAGMGIDFNIPLGTDTFRWVTSLEMFDFRGRDRFDDKRPHFKWINRVFFLRNLYMTFGADDFISKENANGFFGAGMRFCDDDFKYLIAQCGIGGIT